MPSTKRLAKLAPAECGLDEKVLPSGCGSDSDLEMAFMLYLRGRKDKADACAMNKLARFGTIEEILARLVDVGLVYADIAADGSTWSLTPLAKELAGCC